MTERAATGVRRPTMTSRAKWLLRARPGDYMLALSDAMAFAARGRQAIWSRWAV